MIYKIFCVKDIVSGQFSKLEMFVNEDCAIRWYNDLLKESKIAKDLQLWHIGTFDIVSGQFEYSLEYTQGGELVE